MRGAIRKKTVRRTTAACRPFSDALAIADPLCERGVQLVLGRTVCNPYDPMGRLFLNILATFAEFEADLIRMRTREDMAVTRAGGNCAASRPNCPSDSSGNSAPCTPPVGISSAISPNSSPRQDQPSIARSTGAFLRSVRFCPLPESTRVSLESVPSPLARFLGVPRHRHHGKDGFRDHPRVPCQSNLSGRWRQRGD